MKYPWIICAGAVRSGSTLQFNIVYEILIHTKNCFKPPYTDENDFPKIREKYNHIKEYKIIKVHRVTPIIENEIVNNNAILFYTYRDIRDVICSLISKGWIKNDLKSIIDATNSYLSNYAEWAKLQGYNSYVTKYENFYNNIRNELDNISSFFNVKMNTNILNNIEKKYNAKKLKNELKEIDSNSIQTYGKLIFDKNTLFHKNHITNLLPNSYLNSLNHETILTIEKIAMDWLVEHEYKLNNYDIQKKTKEHKFL